MGRMRLTDAPASFIGHWTGMTDVVTRPGFR